VLSHNSEALSGQRRAPMNNKQVRMNYALVSRTAEVESGAGINHLQATQLKTFIHAFVTEYG